MSRTHAGIETKVHTFQAADWIANAGDQLTVPIDEQRSNNQLPLRSFILGGAASSINHHPYIYGGGKTIPWYLKFPALDTGGMVAGVVFGRRDSAFDRETIGATGGSPVTRPWTLDPPVALIATIAMPVLNAKQFVMMGLREHTTAFKVPAQPQLTDDQTWDSIQALTGSSAPYAQDYNGLAGIVFHGGDSDGNLRLYRKGYKGGSASAGWPANLTASTVSSPFCVGGGPACGAAPEIIITDDHDAGGVGYEIARGSDTTITVTGGAITDISASFVPGYPIRVIAGTTVVYATVVSASWNGGSSTLTITVAESVIVAGLSLGTTGDSIAHGGIPDKFVWRGGILLTAAGIYGLIGGQGDVANEFRVVPYPTRQQFPDLAFGSGFEAFIASFTYASGFSGAASAVRVYGMSMVEFGDPAAVQEMIGDSRVLVL